MGDILKKIRKMERQETSPLDKLLGKSDEPPEEEEEEEKMEITHYGRTVAGSETTEAGTTEGGSKGGFQEVDLKARPESLTILKSDAVREIPMEDLDSEPTVSSGAAAAEDPPADEETVIRMTTRDVKKIRHMKLITHLLEEGFFDQAIEAIRELQKLA